MTELQTLIWIEKYRPAKFEDLILNKKDGLLKYLHNPKAMPSFIFYSSKPGTGKTSAAKIIIDYLKCDSLCINSSDERGIDTIRDKIKLFAGSLSLSDGKRCVFLDEADGLTKQAQDSLRNLMETYSDNCFFIFSCNDIGKISEPIRSRCVGIDFETPNKADILNRLEYICEKEKIKTEEKVLILLIDSFYPDIRSIIVRLQQHKIDGLPINFDEKEFKAFLEAIKKKDVTYLYEKTYGGFPIIEFNRWFFIYLFNHWKTIGLDKTAKISLLLADTEKSWNLGTNLPIVFLSNIIEISRFYE
jgi:DNA polymerase III delta prime subunit